MDIKVLAQRAEDLDVVNSARVSYSSYHDELQEGDDKLIAYLMREHHGTPFEHGYFKFYVEAPIFIFREWHRHRIGHSYNEMSGRYVELEQKFHFPDQWRTQMGKPGAYTYKGLTEGPARAANIELACAYQNAWTAYQKLLHSGIAKEQARMVLPLGIYSKMIWSCNPRSLMHFCGLRNAPDAQAEIRELAAKAEDFLITAMPITAKAFVDNGRVAP